MLVIARGKKRVRISSINENKVQNELLYDIHSKPHQGGEGEKTEDPFYALKASNSLNKNSRDVLSFEGGQANPHLF